MDVPEYPRYLVGRVIAQGGLKIGLFRLWEPLLRLLISDVGW